MPTHLGLILDGNRRWARSQGLPTLEGHRRGYDNLHTILDAALDRGIKVVSAYVFSTENWSRTKEEVKYLMDLIVLMLKKDVREMHERGVRIVWLGSKQQVGKRVLKAIEDAEELTKHNTKATFAMCFNHGGQREIAEAVQRLVRDGVPSEDINEQKITEYIDHPELPPLDLIVRTSGEQRLSNFMLWRAAYAELIFVPKHWPEFSVDDLDMALDEFVSRSRRHGK